MKLITRNFLPCFSKKKSNRKYKKNLGRYGAITIIIIIIIIIIINKAASRNVKIYRAGKFNSPSSYIIQKNHSFSATKHEKISIFQVD